MVLRWLHECRVPAGRFPRFRTAEHSKEAQKWGDRVGWVNPAGDAVGALGYLAEGKWTSAGISVASIVGLDALKFLKKGDKAVDAAKMIDNISAPKNGGRVFWSGGTTAREGAEAFARQTGGQTLEMTRTGKFLDAITTEKTYPYLKPAWNRASQNFARGADGAVDVFQSSQGVRLESVWKTVEYPELMKAGNAINFHVTP